MNPSLYISMSDYLMGRDAAYPLSPEQIGNANTIVPRINQLLEAFGEHRAVTSGYRPEALNSKITNAAKRSNHIMCLACDLQDTDGQLDVWCLDNLQILKNIGLWLEDPNSTPGWCHLQCAPPHSGARVFIP